MNNTFNEKEEQYYRGNYNNNYNPNYQNNNQNNMQQEYYNPDYQDNDMNEEYRSQQQFYQDNENNYNQPYQNDEVVNRNNEQQYYQNQNYGNNYNQDYHNENIEEDYTNQQYYYDGNNTNEYVENYENNNVNVEMYGQQCQGNINNQNGNYNPYYQNDIGIGYDREPQEYLNDNFGENYSYNYQNGMGINNEYFNQQQNYQIGNMNYEYGNYQYNEEDDISELKTKKTKKGKAKEKPIEEMIGEGMIAPKNLRLKAYLLDKIFFLIPVLLFYFGMLHDRIMDTVDTMINYDIDVSNLYYLIGPIFSFVVVYELIYFVYYVAMVSFLQGKSLGKKICHLSITSVNPDVEGLPMSVLFKREFVYKLLSSILFIGYIRSMFSKNGVTIHDKSSQTRVIIEEE